jgi:UDP-N-acetylmuramoyl-tripeptide--D-alanyl-D-alanine ligase
VGNYSENILRAVSDSGCSDISLRHFRSNSDALEYILSIVKNGDFILIKGSRGMKMEQIADGIVKSVEKAN